MVPTKPRFVTYFRVSTQKQGRSGLGLEAQKSAVESYLVQQGGICLATFTEVESGKLNERPQLTAALQRCRQTRATLLVAKLDRLSRNAAFLLNLKASEVKFQALDLPEANTLTLGIMATLAQHERELISARTKAALAARKARGLPLGTNRDMKPYQARASVLGTAAKHAKALARAREIAPAIDEAKALGHSSLRQIAAHLDSQGITTPAGKTWSAAAVLRTLALIEA